MDVATYGTTKLSAILTVGKPFYFMIINLCLALYRMNANNKQKESSKSMPIDALIAIHASEPTCYRTIDA